MIALPEHSFGHYRLLSQLASGPRGVVYHARERSSDRDIALKIFEPAGHDEVARAHLARFFRDLEIAARLEHPNLVPVYEFGELEDRPFIAMELCDGPILAPLLRRSERPPFHEAVQLVVEIARVLDLAHNEELFHRNLKPSNLIFHEGRIRLTDFGAIHLPEIRSLEAGIAGAETLRYRAPEQLLGQPVDGRTDQFALGILFYQLITGVYPFPSQRSGAGQTGRERPSPPRWWNPSLVPDIDPVCGRVLDREPQERYPTCMNFAHALELVLNRSGGGRTALGQGAADRSAMGVATEQYAPAQDLLEDDGEMIQGILVEDPDEDEELEQAIDASVFPDDGEEAALFGSEAPDGTSEDAPAAGAPEQRQEEVAIFGDPDAYESQGEVAIFGGEPDDSAHDEGIVVAVGDPGAPQETENLGGTSQEDEADEGIILSVGHPDEDAEEGVILTVDGEPSGLEPGEGRLKASATAARPAPEPMTGHAAGGETLQVKDRAAIRDTDPIPPIPGHRAGRAARGDTHQAKSRARRDTDPLPGFSRERVARGDTPQAKDCAAIRDSGSSPNERSRPHQVHAPGATLPEPPQGKRTRPARGDSSGKQRPAGPRFRAPGAFVPESAAELEAQRSEARSASGAQPFQTPGAFSPRPFETTVRNIFQVPGAFSPQGPAVPGNRPRPPGSSAAGPGGPTPFTDPATLSPGEDPELAALIAANQRGAIPVSMGMEGANGPGNRSILRRVVYLIASVAVALAVLHFFGPDATLTGTGMPPAPNRAPANLEGWKRLPGGGIAPGDPSVNQMAEPSDLERREFLPLDAPGDPLVNQAQLPRPPEPPPSVAQPENAAHEEISSPGTSPAGSPGERPAGKSGPQKASRDVSVSPAGPQAIAPGATGSPVGNPLLSP